MSFIIDFLEQMQIFNILSPVFELLISLVVWLSLAPLLPGIINKVKAWVAGRKGPRLFQRYYDLAKLWKPVLSSAILHPPVLSQQLQSPGLLSWPPRYWFL